MRGIEHSAVTITRYDVRSDRVPRSATFAFVSDLHNYDSSPVLGALERISPLAVLVGGDFIQSAADCEAGISFLRLAASKWPVFCSTGKEHSFDDDMIARLEETGARILRNESVLFHGFRVGGLNTIPLRGKPLEEQERLISIDRAWLERYGREEGFRLLMCHHPEYYDLFVRDYPVDLVLAGHAHGGQWRLFGRGLYAPGQGWFPKYTCGMYDSRMIVGRGLGNSHRIPRLNNGPEVLAVEIHR